jgi:hypothetical protein
VKENAATPAANNHGFNIQNLMSLGGRPMAAPMVTFSHRRLNRPAPAAINRADDAAHAGA